MYSDVLMLLSKEKLIFRKLDKIIISSNVGIVQAFIFTFRKSSNVLFKELEFKISRDFPGGPIVKTPCLHKSDRVLHATWYGQKISYMRY